MEKTKKNVSVEGSQTQTDYMPLYRAQRGSNDEILQSPNEKFCGPEQDLVTGHSNGPFESTEDMEYLESESLNNNAMACATPLNNPQHHSTIFSYETDEGVTSSSEDEYLEECSESLFGDYCSSSSNNEVLSHLKGKFSRKIKNY